MKILFDINNLILLITFSINLGLCLYIYFNNRKNEINVAFSALLLMIAAWILSFIFFIQSRDAFSLLYWRKMTPAGASLIAAFFLYFSLALTQKEKIKNDLQKILVLLPGFIFALVSVFSSLIIKDFFIINPFLPYIGKTATGRFYLLFAIYFLIYFFLGIALLLYKYIRSEGIEKLQLWYVIFGIFTAGILGIIFSLALPFFGIGQFFTFGPFFTILVAAFSAYAILKHKLLNIEDFLSRGIVFLAVVSTIVATFAAMLDNKINFLLPAYTIIANVSLGSVIYLQNPKNSINKSFSFSVFLIALWSLSNLLSDVSTSYVDALFWNRMVLMIASIIPVSATFFAIYFPEGLISVSSLAKILIVAPGLAFAFISLFTNLVVKDVNFVSWGTSINFGYFFPAQSFYLIISLLFVIARLTQKYFKFQGNYKEQIKYVLAGCFISIILALSTNVVLPMLGYPRLTSLGPSFMLILTGFTTYAILKHRLMSIELIIQRGFVYTGVTALILAFYALAVIISETFFRKFLGYTSIVITSGAALIIAIAYHPLVSSFQNLTDRFFFRGRYDYQKTLREISQKIASVIKLEELTKLIVSSFIDTMKVSEISFLILEKEKEHFVSIPISLTRYKKIEIDVQSPIVTWLSETGDVLALDEVETEIARFNVKERFIGKTGITLEELRDEIDRLGVPVWVPIVSKNDMIGIIAVGNKLSGEVFSTEDIGLLSTLSNQTAVALDNARLYDEVVNMKEYNEDILQSMVSGVLTVDIKGKIITFNQMAEKITGKSNILGKTCKDVWGERGTITNIIEDTLKKEKLYSNYESGVLSPDRGLVPASFSSTILFDHNNKKIGALLNIQDLTEVKELEEKVRRADKLSALATMAAGMAHEIKNPLSSMKVLSQLLPIKYQDEEFRNKFIQIMPNEISRIDRIVESLLGFARATAPKYEKMKIEDVVNENLAYYAEQAKTARVKFNVNYAALPQVMGDHDQLSQVFSNLILNAIQAMPEGGELGVKTYEGKKIENVLQNITIEISDTGHGIPAQNIKKLFDPFFTTKYAGTGLGLTITHSIIDGHRGTIDVKSVPGKGTAFTITLPVSQELV